MLCLLSPLMSIDTSFVSIYLRKWISQSGWVALSKVSLKPPLTPFSSSFPKDSSILVQETSGFHQRVNTWIVPSFRVEALGQSLLGIYRLPCEELWDAGIRSVWHCMHGPKSNVGSTVKGRYSTGLQQNRFRSSSCLLVPTTQKGSGNFGEFVHLNNKLIFGIA